MMNNSELLDFDKLPSGYRFRPSDVDLLFYLNKKVRGQPLPPNNIIPLNLYAFHPQQLAGEKEGFFFTQREKKYTNGKRPKRSVEEGDGGGGGYWKATGAEREIIGPDDDRKIIGYKRSLVFYSGTHLHGHKTNWIMHEYRVAAPPPTTHHHHHNNYNHDMRLDEWVVCRVYKNKYRNIIRRDGGVGGSSNSRRLIWADDDHGGLQHVGQINIHIPDDHDHQLPLALHLQPPPPAAADDDEANNNVDEDEEWTRSNDHPAVVEEHAVLPQPPPPAAAVDVVVPPPADGGNNKNGADVVGETTTQQEMNKQQLDDEVMMYIARTDFYDGYGYTDLNPSEDYITIGDDIWE